MVMPDRVSARPSIRTSARLSVRQCLRFSPTCFYTLSWNFAYDFVLLYYRSSFSIVHCVNFVESMPLFGTKNTGNTQFSALFSFMLWHVELPFCILISFYELQIKFQWHQFSTILLLLLLLNWLFNVTINDISVIYVTAHRCAGGLKKKLDLRSGSQRHRHFVGFFNVPVLAPTRDHPFYTVIPTHRPI